MPATTAETLSLVTRNVSVAPLVLLSAADHYGRQAKGTKKRVVGVLLGQNDGKNVRVSNSFAGTVAYSSPPPQAAVGAAQLQAERSLFRAEDMR
jgi:26S proteasome regulatory subunit N8